MKLYKLWNMLPNCWTYKQKTKLSNDSDWVCFRVFYITLFERKFEIYKQPITQEEL